MKRKIEIVQCYYVDETDERVYKKSKKARNAIKNGHLVRAIVTTKEGEKRLGTSFIVSIRKKYIETNNSLYVFV